MITSDSYRVYFSSPGNDRIIEWITPFIDLYPGLAFDDFRPENFDVATNWRVFKDILY